MEERQQKGWKTKDEGVEQDAWKEGGDREMGDGGI